MTGQGSSLQTAGFFPREWKRFFAFLRTPQLPPLASGPGTGALGSALLLYALDIVLMAVLVACAFVAVGLGLDLPENDLEGLDLDLATVALLVLAAPITEEIAFRGWLSGRAGHVFALLAIFAGLIGIPVADATLASPLAGGGFALLGMVMACMALWHWRGQLAWRWYSRHFRWFYYASSLAFALVHFSNYQPDGGLILFALVIPQLIAGLIFGYARVNYGLWSSMLLHILHNGTAIGLVMLFEGG
jgi:membrane protease YdiL (CAAX protease family)